MAERKRRLKSLVISWLLLCWSYVVPQLNNPESRKWMNGRRHFLIKSSTFYLRPLLACSGRNFSLYMQSYGSVQVKIVSIRGRQSSDNCWSVSRKRKKTGNLCHTFCVGHDKPVSSVSWSLNRQWWLSASEDRSLRIWSHGSGEPAIIVVNAQCNVSLLFDHWKQWEPVLTHSCCTPNDSPLCS